MKAGSAGDEIYDYGSENFQLDGSEGVEFLEGSRASSSTLVKAKGLKLSTVNGGDYSDDEL